MKEYWHSIVNLGGWEKATKEEARTLLAPLTQSVPFHGKFSFMKDEPDMRDVITFTDYGTHVMRITPNNDHWKHVIRSFTIANDGEFATILLNNPFGVKWYPDNYITVWMLDPSLESSRGQYVYRVDYTFLAQGFDFQYSHGDISIQPCTVRGKVGKPRVQRARWNVVQQMFPHLSKPEAPIES